MSLTYITLLMPAFALLIPPAHLTDAPSPAYRTLYYRLKRLLIHIINFQITFEMVAQGNQNKLTTDNICFSWCID